MYGGYEEGGAQSVSKTGGRRFEPCHSCQLIKDLARICKFRRSPVTFLRASAPAPGLPMRSLPGAPRRNSAHGWRAEAGWLGSQPRGGSRTQWAAPWAPGTAVRADKPGTGGHRLL